MWSSRGVQPPGHPLSGRCLEQLASIRYGDPYIKGTKRYFFLYLLTMFSCFFHIIFGPWRGQILRKRVGHYKHWRGMIDKPILELLTFGSNLDFVSFLRKKLNFQAMIKSAASAASPIAWGEPGQRLRLAGDGFGALAKQSGRLR